MDRDNPDSRRKRGGLRSPAGGRPPGAKSALGYGEVKAIKAAGLRVPDKAPQEHRELADEALERICDVMRGKVSYLDAGGVLKSAVHLRSEICGPVAQKVEASGPDGGPLEIVIKTVTE